MKPRAKSVPHRQIDTAIHSRRPGSHLLACRTTINPSDLDPPSSSAACCLVPPPPLRLSKQWLKVRTNPWRFELPAFKEIGLLWGVGDKLQQLELIVAQLQFVLHEQTSYEVIKVWLQCVGDLVFEVDNVLDEFRTEAQWRPSWLKGIQCLKKVRIFFPSSNQFVFRMKIAHKIKDVRKKFNVFALLRRF